MNSTEVSGSLLARRFSVVILGGYYPSRVHERPLYFMGWKEKEISIQCIRVGRVQMYFSYVQKNQ